MMLQKMRAGAQGMAAKILVGVIVFVLAVFGFGAFDLFSVSEPVAATVNGDEITERAVEAEIARQRGMYRAQFGEQATDAVLESLVTPQLALSRLVQNTLLDQVAADFDLGVDRQRLMAGIRESFGALGAFDEDLYRRRLAELGYTPTSFQQERASEVQRRQISVGFGETAFVTERELRRVARLQTQRRDIAWLVFDAERLGAGVEVADADIEQHYGNFLDRYMTEERFDFDLVRVPKARFEEGVEIGEEAIAAAYADEVEALREPQRRAAHILLEVGGERTADEAAQSLAAVRAEIEAGASFADKARELSEDVATSDDGGDLGASGRGVFPEAFEEALWALEPGGISAPVETEFGVHLITLLGIEEAQVPTLEERRDEILADLRADEAQRLFDQAQRDIDAIAFEQPDSLAPLSAQYGIAVDTLAGATRSDAQGLLAAPDARAALFSDDVLLEGFNSRAVALDTEIVVARLRARHPSTERPLGEVRDAIRDEISRQRALALSEQLAVASFDSLAQEATPASVAESTGFDWERSDATPLGGDPDREIPPAVLRAAFDMPVPPPQQRELQLATLADGSQAIVVLSGVQLGDYDAMLESERGELADAMQRGSGQRDYAALLATLQTDAEIDAPALLTPVED